MAKKTTVKNETKLRQYIEKQSNDIKSGSTAVQDNSQRTQTDKKLLLRKRS